MGRIHYIAGDRLDYNFKDECRVKRFQYAKQKLLGNRELYAKHEN